MNIEKCLDEGRCKILCLKRTTFLNFLNLKQGQPYQLKFDQEVDLPDDFKVINVNTNFENNCIEALIVHESFPVTDPACQYMRVYIPDPIICADFKKTEKLTMGPVGQALLGEQ